MRELIKNVAEIIGDLQTLNLLEKKNVTTILKLDEQTKKEILTVKVIVSSEDIFFCVWIRSVISKIQVVM